MNMKITHRMGVFFCFIGTTVFAVAQVVMDSTLGQAGPLAGPNFQIPANLGKTVGNNLFHSFAEFSLTSDQSAIFIIVTLTKFWLKANADTVMPKTS